MTQNTDFWMKITVSDNGNAMLSFISEKSFKKGLKCNQEGHHNKNTTQ